MTVCDDCEKLRAWMRRMQKMLSSDDMKSVFLFANLHGYALSPTTAEEISAIWCEYDALMGTTPFERGMA